MTVNVQDLMYNCSPPPVTIGGLIATEPLLGAEGIGGVEVSLESDPGAYSLIQLTGNDGSFLFPDAFPLDFGYVLTPVKDLNPLNGVTTYDLVLISRHILGLETLPSPYRIIAADANKSGSVTTFDIVQLRKLILGLEADLPNNTSWRFVDKTYQFPNPLNPFSAVFPEIISRPIAEHDRLSEDFVGIKIGDVNGTAAPDSLTAPDDRNAETVWLETPDRDVQAGETWSAPFTASSPLLGMQFTLNTGDLEVLDIRPGAGMTAENFAVFPEREAITASWHVPAALAAETPTEFTVVFRVRKAGRLSELLSISGRITPAEAYKPAGNHAESMDIALRFDHNSTPSAGLEVDQNEPNPFTGTTRIGFRLPEAMPATLTVFDAHGRELLRRTETYSRGHHTITLDAYDLPAGGVLHYKIETPAGSASRKMVVIR
jgi:hypothetical protein